MKRKTKEEQVSLINNFRTNNSSLREEIFNYYYTNAMKYLGKLHIPSDIKEDLTQEVAVCILDLIDTYEFKSDKHISFMIHDKIVRVIIAYLYTVYSYNKELNGKKYRNPYTYLQAKCGFGKNPTDILHEIIRYGKRREEQLSDVVTSDDYMESIADNSLLVDKYFLYASTLPYSKRIIFLGRIPICEEAYKTEKELSDILGVEEQRIGQVAEETKYGFLAYDNVAYLLGFTREERIKLIRKKYLVRTI